jgi:hypothetical protein
MENKEELNQNLEDAEMQNQEENAEAVQETVENDTKTESPNAILSEDIPEDQGETKKEEVNTTSSDDESYDFGREGKLDSEDCEDEDCDDDEENDEEVAEVGKDVVELSDEAYEKQYKDFKLADIITVLEVLSEEEDLRKSRSKVNILRRLIDKKLVELEKIELGQFIAKGGIEAEFSVEEATEYIRYKKVLGLFSARKGANRKSR